MTDQSYLKIKITISIVKKTISIKITIGTFTINNSQFIIKKSCQKQF